MIDAFSHFKLGLFTLVALAAIAVAALVIDVNRRDEDKFYTYFDESVQGLDVGGHVKFRGVRIGRVSKVEFAPDRRHVMVVLSIDRKRARSLGLHSAGDIRAEIVMMGITGVKLVDLDVAGPDAPPPAPLPFTPHQPYLASRPSLLGSLKTRVGVTFDKVDDLVDNISSLAIAGRGAVENASHLVRDFDRAQIPSRVNAALAELRTTSRQLGLIASDARGHDGMFARASRATDSIADLSRDVRESTVDLSGTLREVREAARSIRELMDALVRDPDMLIKGRAK